MVDKFAQERVLKGYLKQIGDMFYVKDIDTYILIPIEIKEIETDIDSVYTDRINQIVEFELHETDNLDKLTATLCDRKIDSICNKIKQCFETQEIIKGVVKQKRKCGLSIAMSKNSNFSAFLPSSQIDIKKNVNYDDLIGKEIELRVIQFNEESGNTVVSRRAVIKEQLEKRKNQFFSDLKIGQVVKGIVSNIQKYGAFVDLGDAVGLIFISELSDEKIKNINDILSVGQEINAVVLNIDEEKKRISLGLKQYLSLTPKIKIKPTGEKIDLNTILDAAPKKTLSRREKKRKISERQRQKKLTEQIIKRKLMEENNLIL
ncbi:MAG: S1 RNA-binding domain-containing protein [Prevotellaceae bacterium]|nr:S1 RNA-binding domain-containing protein [Prevotellaceae bacterium]